MNSNRHRAIILVLLVLLMAATRIHLLFHFAPVPDASWAVFFIAGFYLRGWGKWAFPLLMAVAVAVDYVAITRQGLDFWSHYCMSAAYWFLVPAYFTLWMGGSLSRRFHDASHSPGKSLGVLVAALVLSVVVCQLLSQGSFYWISDSVANPTLAGWWANYSEWLLPFMRTTAIYVGLAVIVHAGVQQAARLARPHGKSLR
jgi:hypothetical protein